MVLLVQDPIQAFLDFCGFNFRDIRFNVVFTFHGFFMCHKLRNACTSFVVLAVHKSNALQLFCIQICQIRHSTFSNHLSIWRTCYIWALVVPSSNHLYITLYFYKQYVSASTKKWFLHSFFPHVLSTVPTFFIPLLWSRHHYIN